MSNIYMRDKQINGLLTVVKKMPLSKNGNPKYIVKIQGLHKDIELPVEWNTQTEIFDTGNDAMLGYEITNFDNKNVIADVRFLKRGNVVFNVSEVKK